MYPSNNIRSIIKPTIRLILLICSIAVVIVFNKYFDLEKLKKIHIDQEKRIGEAEVNKALYKYDSETHIVKSIHTDYNYLSVLPGLRKYYVGGAVQELQTSSPLFDDISIGYLLTTPSGSNEIPVFIETRIKSGQYIEIFNIKGYRFIKIR
jgi:hypothetical protein